LRGICKVRFNDAGQVQVPFGYVAGLQCDPVEKKPFFHVYPGSDALTFGMMGCDLHCQNCQNWLTSQALRDSDAVAPVRPVTPSQLVDAARREQARLVVSSYNEPLITAEWAVAVFREATAAGLACAFVSNGNATPEALDFLRPWIIAYKVDLKSFDDRNYRTLGGTLDSITHTIRMIHERGLWLEVVTLIIPGFNDSTEELRRIARFLVSVSPDIPWHVTAFHKDYRMTDPEATPASTLIRAAEIGTAEGLRFVYAGNLPGRVGDWETTWCPSCRTPLIERFGYLVRAYRITPTGCCPQCQTRIPGIWPDNARTVRTGADMHAYQSRLPRPVAPAAHGALRSLPMAADPPVDEVTQAMAPATSATPDDSASSAPRPRLTGIQKEQLLAAAARMVRAAVAGQTPAFPTDMPDVGEHPVAGAFVSLKRGRHLRSCSGLLNPPMLLARAVEEAVARTVWEDSRFPPISPTELDHLTMEVWLLYDPERVEALGEDRLQAVTVGKHGVRIARDQAHTLFLPGVATESNWNARQLLDQLCLKAGLFPTAWREDAASLQIFEGEALGGLLGAFAGVASSVERTPVVSPADLPAYEHYCRRNLAALLTGATPEYYLAGAPDGMVNGVVLSLHRSGSTEVVHVSKITLRPAFPLQSTLFSLLQAAAQTLASRRMTLEMFDSLLIGLTFLDDPVLHGTVADPHLAGVVPGQRAVMVHERNKFGLRFVPEMSAEQLTEEAARLAEVTHPDHASVVSFGVVTSMAQLDVATVPQPVRGHAVRPPAVAGKFYDVHPEDLARTVDRLLAGERRPEPWAAAMVPHAGLRFSGQIAADVLNRIQLPRTIIVIGPKHTALGMDWAVAPHQTWAFPGGSMEGDFMWARRLSQAIPGLAMDAAAHQQEHAIEVELPLLARLAPQSRVVGIVIGHGDLVSCRRIATGLAELMRESPDRPLLLISSDMNHFATDAENRRLDALALEALLSCQPTELYETVTQNHVSMCGVLPAVIVLETLQLLGIQPRAELVGYATTADVTGDSSRVVGYAGMLFG
jgi:AmmeMemoRadiSam system radical SAM enzyme/AmmeMemoRadiSam system protein B/AmmeMemoRadiSam system protein A